MLNTQSGSMTYKLYSRVDSLNASTGIQTNIDCELKKQWDFKNFVVLQCMYHNFLHLSTCQAKNLLCLACLLLLGYSEEWKKKRKLN